MKKDKSRTEPLKVRKSGKSKPVDRSDEFITLPSFSVHPYKAPLKKLGVRNWQIAKICGISYGYMSHILNGVVPMPDYVAITIRKFLSQRGIDVS